MKKCQIINGSDAWILKVDGHNIPFQGSYNAIYFQNHYRALGYEVTVEDPWLVTETGYQELRDFRNELRDRFEKNSGSGYLQNKIKEIDGLLTQIEDINPEWQNRYKPDKP